MLDAIANQPRHGYEVIQAIEERTHGAYRPSPGVIYPTLQLLEELGHARTVEQDNRRVYAITDAGKADLDAHRGEVDDFYERSSEDSWERHAADLGDLFRHAADLFRSFKRAARRGQMSPQVQARIRKVLDDAIRQIEEILREQRR